MIVTIIVLTLAVGLALLVAVTIIGLTRETTARPRNHVTVAQLIDLEPSSDALQASRKTW